MKKIFLDVETTGLNPVKNNITEIAMLYECGNGTYSFQRYIKYDMYPDNYEEVVAPLTGLTAQFLEKNGVSNGQAFDEMIEWLSARINNYDKEDKAVMYGYNVSFDNDFLRFFFKENDNNYMGSYFYNCRVDVLSTVGEALAAGVIPPLQNYKMETVAKHLGIEYKAHSAIEDVKVTKDVYNILQKLIRGKQ